MKDFLIPLAIAGIILIPLAVLLWLGARERRQVSFLMDPELGGLKLFKTYWETIAPIRIGKISVVVSGEGEAAGPTKVQKATLEFVKNNASELFTSTINAGKETIAPFALDKQIDDLQISNVFLHDVNGSFELFIESQSLAKLIPNGVSVSFDEKKIDDVEIVH